MPQLAPAICQSAVLPICLICEIAACKFLRACELINRANEQLLFISARFWVSFPDLFQKLGARHTKSFKFSSLMTAACERRARRERIFDLGESTLGKSKFQLRPRKWDTFFRFAHELRQSKYLVGNITSAAFIQAERGYERASGAHSAPSAHLQIKIFW